MKLTKRQLSLKLNVSDITVYLWEKNRVQPSLAQIPRIIEFLGHDPFGKKTEYLGARIREYRRIRGVAQKKLAEQLGVDPSILASWERGENNPREIALNRLLTILNSCSSNPYGVPDH